jgi:CheY-like chemotaxis protein
MHSDTILVVDDNPMNLKLLRLLLAHEGFDVVTAIDAEAAEVVLATVHPTLILMDIQLPGKDGLDFTREIKANPTTRGITIIALTAYAMKGDDQKALAAGCDGYIPKPIDIETFIQDIQTYLISSDIRDRGGETLISG